MRRRLLPLSRDQLMLLMAAINELFLGIDIYLAHSISGTIRPYEWIPIIFGPVAARAAAGAGLIALRRRPLASVIATVVLLASIVVGLLGAYFHCARAILPTAPPGEQVTVDLLVWAPPILAPLTFSLVGLLGLSAAWVEEPPDSGDRCAALAAPHAGAAVQQDAGLLLHGQPGHPGDGDQQRARSRPHRLREPVAVDADGVGVFATVIAGSSGRSRTAGAPT